MRADQRMVLRVVQDLEEADAQVISRRLVVSPSYVDESCRVLVEKGYLVRTAAGGYKLAPKGEKYNLGNYIPTPRKTEKYYPIRGCILAPVTSFKYTPRYQQKRRWRRW